MGVQNCCGQESCTEYDRPPKNDTRCQLINEIKELIGNMENEEKTKPRQSKRPDKRVPGMRDLEDECHQWRKRRDCTPPLITAIAIHETRPTSDYTNMRHENSSQVTYVDATTEGQEMKEASPAPWDLPRTPSQELRAGTLYSDCQCLKRNGLQFDCPRWECGGRPECVAVNPGPCCLPSRSKKPVRGDRRYGNRPSLKEAPIGTPGYKGKPLKTGPLNYDICIPYEASSQSLGTPGGAGQGGMEFIDRGKVPQQGEKKVQIDVVTIGQMHPLPTQGAPFQNIQGFAHSNQSNQGRNQLDVSMVLNPNQIHPGVVSQPITHQNQAAGQQITLTGPGMTCCCRPLQSTQTAGSEMLRVHGVPFAVVSSPMP